MTKKISKKKQSVFDKLKSYFVNKEYKDTLKKIKSRVISFSRYNVQFISFVVLNLISCALLRKFTTNNLWFMYGSFFDLSVLILLGSLAYLFKPKKQFWYFFIVSLVIFLMNIINTVYYSFFSSFASFALLATLRQASEQGGAVMEKIKWIYYLYLIFPIIFIFINRYLTKKEYFKVVEKIESSRKLMIGSLIVGGICLFINISTLEGKDLSRISKQWNREYIVERFGIIVYQGNDLVQTICSSLSSMFGFEEAANNFAEYYNNNTREKSNNKYTNVYKDYNVIAIHLESIMQFLIDLKINGVEVTPNLNKLVKESMYFDNFYSQVSVGTSSDAEFTFNSSLLPVQSGTVFVSYYNRHYITLESILAENGYYTFSMHANKASMWNRDKMHPSLGYKDFYSKEYYDVDEVVGLGLSDHSFFIQSEKIIGDIKNKTLPNEGYKNFMGTIITLSNHTPFDIENYKDPETLLDVTYHTGKRDINGNEIVWDYLTSKDGEMVGKYLQSVHYADECLGEFIEYVKRSPDFDKTVFVMYGDHAAQLSKKQFNYFVNFNPETGQLRTEEDNDPEYINYDYYENEIFKKVPFIIWSKDHKVKGKYSYPMGMIDALPTISNMLGIYNPYALGHDIFSVKKDNVVVFPNGNFLTNTLYYSNSKNEYRILNENTTIDANYIDEKKEYAEKILDISNDIIVYDLIEKASDRIGVTTNEQERNK